MSRNNIAFAFAIFIIIIIIIARFARPSFRESLSSEECGTTGRISLPYDALARFDRVQRREGPPDFGQIATAQSGTPASYAIACDQTPGCVAFDTYGVLYSGFREQSAWRATTDKDTYVRKCAQPEPIYFEWYTLPNFQGDKWYIPARKHTYLDSAPLTDVIGPRNGFNASIFAMSLIIPMGVSIIFYKSNNCDPSAGYIQLAGNWSSFNSLGTSAFYALSHDVRSDATFTNTPRVVAGAKWW